MSAVAVRVPELKVLNAVVGPSNLPAPLPSAQAWCPLKTHWFVLVTDAKPSQSEITVLTVFTLGELLANVVQNDLIIPQLRSHLVVGRAMMPNGITTVRDDLTPAKVAGSQA